MKNRSKNNKEIDESFVNTSKWWRLFEEKIVIQAKIVKSLMKNLNKPASNKDFVTEKQEICCTSKNN